MIALSHLAQTGTAARADVINKSIDEGEPMLGFVKLAGRCAPKHLALAALVSIAATCGPLSWAASSKSVYLSAPPDPAAVQVTRDGSSDDTHVIQSAIDQ